MIFILASKLKTYIKDENDNRIPTALDDENSILTNIKKYINNTNKIVSVANNENDFTTNEERSQITFESFYKTGFKFKEQIILDARNKDNAKSILSDADVIILNGGKCLCQNDFFNEINLKDILKNKKDGIVMGISAGAMNLCNTIFNFPEELKDKNDPLFLDGMSFYNDIIIPHFDGEQYQLDYNEIDIMNEYILPYSKKYEFIGFPNYSYILIDENNKKHYFGDIYKISKGEIIKIQ